MQSQLESHIPGWISSRRDDVIAACRQYGIARIDLFGSALTTEFNEESDLDFLIEFDNAVPYADRLEAYVALRDVLTRLFGRRVDLTVGRAIRNPHVRAAIDQQRQLLYAA